MNPMVKNDEWISGIFKNIRIAKAGDLSFVLHLQKRFSNQLGFLPKVAIEWYIEHQRVMLAIENDAPAGYVLGRASMRYDRRIAPITQTAVELDLQKSRLGWSLVEAWKFRAAQSNIDMLQCWCLDGIDAQKFWEAIGWHAVGRATSETARGRDRILFRYPLTPEAMLRQNVLPPVAGWKAAKLEHPQMLFDIHRTAIIT